MPVNVSQYVEPGVYIQENPVQGIPGGLVQPRQLVIIGEGARCKNYVNELHVRAYISNLPVTPDPVTRQFTLPFPSDSKTSTMVLSRGGIALDPSSFTLVNASTVQVNQAFFDPTQPYTFSYQSLASSNAVDTLVGDVSGSCAAVQAVGYFPGTRDFVAGVDFVLTSSGIQWLPPQPAIISGVAGTYSGLVGTSFSAVINGGIPQSYTFVSGDFVSPNAATAAEVATALNAHITGLAAVAQGGVIVLKTAITGPSATIQVGGGTADSILGFTDGQLARGAGSNPAQGQQYYVTYTGERPVTDYNRPILTTTLAQALNQVGPLTPTNGLALAAQIAYEQNPPFVWIIQVRNTGQGVAAQDLDYINAIEAATLNQDLTDVVVISNPQIANSGGAQPLVRQALYNHVIAQSSLLARAERLGWFGMKVGTQAGDGETAGTFIYTATQELQVFADSPGHGRFILMGPDSMLKTFRFADGSVQQLKLDGTYLAVAAAAKEASLLSVSDGLLRKTLNGIDDVTQLDRATVDLLAANGVCMIVNRAGSIIFFDPVTTDQTSVEFREINVMVQKDATVKAVRSSLDQALVGVVPDNLAQFKLEVISNIAATLQALIAQGSIAPFQDSSGNVRSIDLSNDIVVTQRATDPTTYDFIFTFFTKFIAKRLFGVYSISVPSGA